MSLLQRESLQEGTTGLVKKSESSMILTTSKRPCTKTRTICKELASVIPLSQYIIRGTKGMRELISLSVEKGAERIVIVISEKENIFMRFFSQWTFLGELSGSVMLRRELGIPKVKPVCEDVPFLLYSSEKDALKIAALFGADRGKDDAYAYMVYKKRWIDFYRLDLSDTPVGPRITVDRVDYARHN
jgi:hypothetical protein